MIPQQWQRFMLLGVTALGGFVTVPTTLPAAAYEPLAPQQLAQTLESVFTSSAGRFAIAFPDDPIISSETDDIDGTPVEIYEFSSENIGSSYTVAYADLPETFLSLGPEMVLDEVRDMLLEDMDLGDFSDLEMNTSMNGHPGRSYRYSNSDFTLDMRLYLVGERMYLVAGADVEEAAVDQFMRSFELL